LKDSIDDLISLNNVSLAHVGPGDDLISLNNISPIHVRPGNDFFFWRSVIFFMACQRRVGTARVAAAKSARRRDAVFIVNEFF
jgi:hypothetical protein